MTFFDPQITQQQCQGFSFHRFTIICMEGQLLRLYLLVSRSRSNQLACQFRAFPLGDHPAHNEATEDIDDSVQSEVSPLGRSTQLSNVPTPDLIRAHCQQFWFLVNRVLTLVTTLSHLCKIVQNAVHRPPMA